MTMQSGKVIKWFGDRGFGFIQPDDDPTQSIFVHVCQFPPHTRIGNGCVVKFKIGMNEHSGKTEAQNVTVIAQSKAVA